MSFESAPSGAISAPSNRRTPVRLGRLRLAGLVCAIALLAAACSSGPGTREELIDVVTQDGAFTTEEATCIADAVFERYGDDEDALGKISAADSFEFFDGEDGVPGFSAFFDETVRGCSAVGPTTG